MELVAEVFVCHGETGAVALHAVTNDLKMLELLIERCFGTSDYHTHMRSTILFWRLSVGILFIQLQRALMRSVTDVGEGGLISS